MSVVGKPVILRQEVGIFDRRFQVGPASWAFFDLLWIHEGAIRLKVGSLNTAIEVKAPGGILIHPNTAFQGHVIGPQSKASILHFQLPNAEFDRFSLPPSGDTLHIQNLIRLSLRYAKRGSKMDKRERLLLAILDCFSEAAAADARETRVESAWHEAREKLGRVRGIADVAAFIGLSESAFRALHREQFKISAGQYLRELRLSEAERILATTGLRLRDIAQSVGYAHPESLSVAFLKSRGKTPGEYRKWCQQFA